MQRDEKRTTANLHQGKGSIDVKRRGEGKKSKEEGGINPEGMEERKGMFASGRKAEKGMRNFIRREARPSATSIIVKKGILLFFEGARDEPLRKRKAGRTDQHLKGIRPSATSAEEREIERR